MLPADRRRGRSSDSPVPPMLSRRRAEVSRLAAVGGNSAKWLGYRAN